MAYLGRADRSDTLSRPLLRGQKTEFSGPQVCAEKTFLTEATWRLAFGKKRDVTPEPAGRDLTRAGRAAAIGDGVPN